jgi:hypothetical protein
MSDLLHLTTSFAFAFCAVVLFLLLQRSLDRASTGPTRRGRHPVQEWISELFVSAIFGAIIGFLLNVLASWLVPEIWEPGDAWGVAWFGALGGMFACFEYKLKETRSRVRKQEHREE